MKIVAAVSVGSFLAIVAGHLVGISLTWPKFRAKSHRPKADATVWLGQAGSSLTPIQFWVGSALIGGTALVVVTAFAGSLVVAVVPAVAVAIIPRTVLAKHRVERAARLRNAWPDGLSDIVASVASGASINQAVEMLSRQGPEPLREALGRYPSLSRMLGAGAALEVLRDELADPTTDRVIEVLLIANERGGAIVKDILEDLARATTRDVRLAEEIHTEGLEMRINARSVVVLPWAVLVLLCIRPGPFRDFYATSAGVVVVLIGALMCALGMLIVGKLGRVESETRVFAAAARNAS